MNRRGRSKATLLATALLALTWAAAPPAWADGIDDFNNSWAGQSLSAQRLLDLDAPIADANIIGAHNSFNSDVYSIPTSYLDPNQVDSIYNQLRMGARAIELDVHWTPKLEGALFPQRLLLCHGDPSHFGCSVTDRYLHEGLDEIAAWLGTGASNDQVLILHIEDHMDGQHGEAYNQINSRFGDRIHRSGGCGDIPSNLTKADVLGSGKNVIIWNEGGCSGDGNWNSTVYTGLGGLGRVWEDSTIIGGIAGSGASINDSDVINYFAGGTNIIDLDQLHQNDSRWVAAIWSWDTNEPNNIGNEDCAAQMGGGRWNDLACANLNPFACKNTFTGGWAISASIDSWGAGTLACDALGSSYRFGLPTNSQDNQSLKAAKDAAGHSNVWLNHNDRWAEGDWTTSSSDTVFYGAGSLILAAGQSVSGKTRRLEMDFDCNLVLRSVSDGVTGGILWTSGTAGAGSNCMLDFQPDGNLVVYDGGAQSQWASGTSGTSGAELHLQADGNVVIYNDVGASLWQTHTNYPSSYGIGAGLLTLTSGQILHSQNRKLEMQDDCNLVLYSYENGVTGGFIWHSGTGGAGTGCYVDFQGDGNLVVYDGAAQPLWAAGTSGTPDGELRLQEDGNLVIYNGAGQPLWTANSNTPSQYAFAADQFELSSGQYLQSQNRKLEMGADCDLVMYSVANFLVGGVLWRSDTAGAGTGCYLDFQADGNLVVYDGADQAQWASGTSGTSGAVLRLQDDGNLVVYNGAGQPLWSTNTNIPSQLVFSAGSLGLNAEQFIQSQGRKLIMQADCNLVMHNVSNALVGAVMWHSDTLGAGSGCYLDFQGDGNLVVYGGGGQPRWASGTSGTVGAELWLQSDGNMVIYNGAGLPLWNSGTQGIFINTGVCGDLACEGETCSTCPGDCGVCEPVCGDYTCGGAERCYNCKADCGPCPPRRRRCGLGFELAFVLPLLAGLRGLGRRHRGQRPT